MSMTVTAIPFELNGKSGVLEVACEPNRSITGSGFDLLAGCGFDVNMCLGYPTMRAYVRSYEGAGYYTASAWIQVITRREFASLDAVEPTAVVATVDAHDLLAELGVPFFAMGYPAEIYDAPCNNLGPWARLQWLADTFLVTMPSRINDHTIAPVAAFRWGYTEYDLDGRRHVEVHPLAVPDDSQWQSHLPLLRRECGNWTFAD
jgi:hypothetical protein